ncbi:MAG TPA: tRNA-specific adenosine deaminase [Bacteroidales bacterium]|nr:MAG: tRNA-specific adenosine deaminase [Bacteroidetes bacterium GWE2_42_24]OFY27556.1 MAG: tRNA-specific adenosine deaminase [Bacteroidetes bacterium GWF2_43_11]HBZ66080.1 tRNA-specific adenosine deaminase [Bacteroidales bacterium]
MEKADDCQVFSVFSDRHFMLEALKEARKAFDADEVPVGAVVVCNNRIIARAHNLTERLKDPTAHAEMMAITAATNALGGKYLTDCTLFVSLEPCVMCAGALGWAQIGRIVYGASDPNRGFSLMAPLAIHPRTVLTTGLEAEEASRLVKEFFARKR